MMIEQTGAEMIADLEKREAVYKTAALLKVKLDIRIAYKNLPESEQTASIWDEAALALAGWGCDDPLLQKCWLGPRPTEEKQP